MRIHQCRKLPTDDRGHHCQDRRRSIEMLADETLEECPFLFPEFFEDAFTWFDLRGAWMNNSKQFLVGHGFDDTNSQHESQPHGQPVHAFQPVNLFHPAEQQMFHVGGCGQQQ